MYSTLKRVFIGPPIASSDEHQHRLIKLIALAVFASDAISSTAYATEEILVVLVPASWAGHPLSQLEMAGKVRVMAVSRLGVAQVPTAELVVQEGDVVYLGVAGDAMASVDDRLAGPVKAGGH